MNPENQLSWSGITTVLRWVAMVPCAGIVSTLIKFPTREMSMTVQFPVGVVAYAAYVWIVGKIAPAHKYKTTLIVTVVTSAASFLLSQLKMREVHATASDWVVFLVGFALNLAVGVYVSFTFRQPTPTAR